MLVPFPSEHILCSVKSCVECPRCFSGELLPMIKACAVSFPVDVLILVEAIVGLETANLGMVDMDAGISW